MNAPSMVEEIQALRNRGFTADFSVTPDGQLRCVSCGQEHPPSGALIESTTRFEGASNPDDEAVLFGLHRDACGVRGVFVAAYARRQRPRRQRSSPHWHPGRRPVSQRRRRGCAG
jgi:hypothetical protein